MNTKINQRDAWTYALFQREVITFAIDMLLTRARRGAYTPAMKPFDRHLTALRKMQYSDVYSSQLREAMASFESELNW
jgi:hypothetical protein